MQNEGFYSLPVRKRHLLERKEEKQLEKRISILNKIDQLKKEIKRLEDELRIVRVKTLEKICVECRNRTVFGYGSYDIHFLDGNHSNKLHSNQAIICPNCHVHILLSPYSPKDIWDLKIKGMNNALIGRYLGISRERVRQLCKKTRSYKETTSIDDLARIAQKNQRTNDEEDKLKAGLDELVKQAKKMEKNLRFQYNGDYDDEFSKIKTKKQRYTDKRTLRKRILGELLKLS